MNDDATQFPARYGAAWFVALNSLAVLIVLGFTLAGAVPGWLAVQFLALFALCAWVAPPVIDRLRALGLAGAAEHLVSVTSVANSALALLSFVVVAGAFDHPSMGIAMMPLGLAVLVVTILDIQFFFHREGRRWPFWTFYQPLVCGSIILLGRPDDFPRLFLAVACVILGPAIAIDSFTRLFLTGANPLPINARQRFRLWLSFPARDLRNLPPWEEIAVAPNPDRRSPVEFLYITLQNRIRQGERSGS